MHTDSILLYLSRLLKLGALEFKKTVEEREEWRIVTCMWLHAGVFHVLANMMGLVFIGSRLEQEFGFCKLIHHAFLLEEIDIRFKVQDALF